VSLNPVHGEVYSIQHYGSPDQYCSNFHQICGMVVCGSILDDHFYCRHSRVIELLSDEKLSFIKVWCTYSILSRLIFFKPYKIIRNGGLRINAHFEVFHCDWNTMVSTLCSVYFTLILGFDILNYLLNGAVMVVIEYLWNQCLSPLKLWVRTNSEKYLDNTEEMIPVEELFYYR
jgi:hypothetical protein